MCENEIKQDNYARPGNRATGSFRDYRLEYNIKFKGGKKTRIHFLKSYAKHNTSGIES